MKKFLLVTYYLDFSGSATYIYTLATALRKKKFNVDIFAFVVEKKIKKQLHKNNVFVSSNLNQLKKNYDIIISQHSVASLIIRAIFPTIPMIFISHGIKSFLDRPPSQNINIKEYIAISEEVKNNLIHNHGVNPKAVSIVRNFIDTRRFIPQRKIGVSPKSLLFISYRYNQRNLSVVQKACRALNLNFMILGKYRRVFNVEKFINKSDIVISLGRGVLEAMSCGRAVIIFDYQGGDGMVTIDNIDKLKRYNFSGRCFRYKHSITGLIKEILKYNNSMGAINRKIIIKDFNIDKEIHTILKICKKAQKSFKARNIDIPVDELLWLCQRIDYFAKKYLENQNFYEVKPRKFTEII